METPIMTGKYGAIANRSLCSNRGSSSSNFNPKIVGIDIFYPDALDMMLDNPTILPSH